MNKSGKVWGESLEIFSSDTTSIHRIVAISGSCCSIHKHQYKHNMFYVESGCIKVESMCQNGLVDETTLKSGEQTTIPPNVYHRFIAMEDSVVYEIYYTKILQEDIIRTNRGNKKYEKSNNFWGHGPGRITPNGPSTE